MPENFDSKPGSLWRTLHSDPSSRLQAETPESTQVTQAMSRWTQVGGPVGGLLPPIGSGSATPSSPGSPEKKASGKVLLEDGKAFRTDVREHERIPGHPGLRRMRRRRRRLED